MACKCNKQTHFVISRVLQWNDTFSPGVELIMGDFILMHDVFARAFDTTRQKTCKLGNLAFAQTFSCISLSSLSLLHLITLRSLWIKRWFNLTLRKMIIYDQFRKTSTNDTNYYQVQWQKAHCMPKIMHQQNKFKCCTNFFLINASNDANTWNELK